MSKVDLEREYKKIAICDYNNRISRLRKEKIEYMKKTEELQNDINNLQIFKQQFCKETLGGHRLREEKECGIYGEVFTVCSTCGLEM